MERNLALTTPFPPDAVHVKPVTVKVNRALAVAYLDAHAIRQRLDTVFGVGGCSESYQLVKWRVRDLHAVGPGRERMAEQDKRRLALREHAGYLDHVVKQAFCCTALSFRFDRFSVLLRWTC
jgi:hypothetical protein